MIKQTIQKIVNNADKFKLYKPENALKWSRSMFFFEEEKENKIMLILSSLTNEVELLIKDSANKEFEKFNFDLSTEENNLLCITFEEILCKERLKFRKNSKEDLEQIKKERKKGIDKSTIEKNKQLQKKAIEFLNNIDFNKKKKEDDKKQDRLKK